MMRKTTALNCCFHGDELSTTFLCSEERKRQSDRFLGRDALDIAATSCWSGSMLLIILILLLLFGGGGGYYAYGPYGGIGIGGIVVIVLIVMLLTGRLR
jgi:hypothetical protein